jgi:hypothetical protein
MKVQRRHFIALGSAFALTTCGVDLLSVRSVDPGARPREGNGVIVGRIRILVDGKPLMFDGLDKPAMRLVSRDNETFNTSPTDRAGYFAWSIPAGGYEIRSIFAPWGVSVDHEGVYPTVWNAAFGNQFAILTAGFFAAGGQTHYIGTIILDTRLIAKRSTALETRSLLRLRSFTIRDDSATDPKWRSFASTPGARKSLIVRKQ